MLERRAFISQINVMHAKLIVGCIALAAPVALLVFIIVVVYRERRRKERQDKENRIAELARMAAMGKDRAVEVQNDWLKARKFKAKPFAEWDAKDVERCKEHIEHD